MFPDRTEVQREYPTCRAFIGQGHELPPSLSTSARNIVDAFGTSCLLELTRVRSSTWMVRSERGYDLHGNTRNDSGHNAFLIMVLMLFLNFQGRKRSIDHSHTSSVRLETAAIRKELQSF